VSIALPSIDAAGVAGSPHEDSQKVGQWIRMIDWNDGAPCKRSGPFSRLWLRLAAPGRRLFHRRTRKLLVNLPGMQDK